LSDFGITYGERSGVTIHIKSKHQKEMAATSSSTMSVISCV